MDDTSKCERLAACCEDVFLIGGFGVGRRHMLVVDFLRGRNGRDQPPPIRAQTPSWCGSQTQQRTGVEVLPARSQHGCRAIRVSRPRQDLERLVDVGQQVTASQPLMRIDETNLRLALTAKRNATIAARAVFVQASADKKRYATLVSGGLAASPQRYEQAKAALDTAEAQLAAAEADAKLRERRKYSTLLADADGTVVTTRGTGTGIAAGQTLVQLGCRAAGGGISLPETIRARSARLPTPVFMAATDAAGLRAFARFRNSRRRPNPHL